MQIRRIRPLSVSLLTLVLAAGPAMGQDEAPAEVPSAGASAEPVPSAGASAESAPSADPLAAEPSPSVPPDAEAVDTVERLGGSWRRVAAAPFGAIDMPGGWTGTELVIVDPRGKRRASSYLPALDRWSNVAKPPRKLLAGSEAQWTGSELLFVEPRGTTKRGLTRFDPVEDAWRTTAGSPLNEIGTSVWAGDRLVAASANGARIATYDPMVDVWTELPSPEDAFVDSLFWTGEDVLALARTGETEALAFIPLDLEEEGGAWGEPSVGPLTPASAPVLWAGETFVSLSPVASPPASSAETDADTEIAVDATTEADANVATDADTEAAASAEPPDGANASPEVPDDPEEPIALPPVNASFDPLTGEWTEVENPCGIDTAGALWAEPLILDVDGRAGLDPATGQCYRTPKPKWAERIGALRVWTGNEVIDVAGETGGKKPRRDGVAYDPYPGDDALGVRLDKGARPVRVTMPSLGIDLPVISTKRKVAGSSPGYPACDVALFWTVFDLPGKPGTAWIMAHAQSGMFLPLLDTLTGEGKHALLGREVDVQLRDGRVLTYRTYRANARAINTNIGRKGRKRDEHRLVLQTSTGIGSAPKLLVAARLVDLGTTEEPRPKPRPRACG